MSLTNGKLRFGFVMLFGAFCVCMSSVFGLTPNDNSKPEVDLEKYEKRVYSQNGEDGVLEKIFGIVGTTSRYYVEFGVENGNECNTRFLRQFYGWKGLMMDLSYQNHNINLNKEKITAENIVELFQKYQVPTEFDLLSIDIDLNDFHVWNTICQFYRPRVVVIEYNGCLSPHEDKVVIYYPNNHWDGTNYYGASILAFYKLGRKYGYSLVYAENRGANIFFVRDDVLESCGSLFKNTNNVEKLFKPLRNAGPGPNGGHTLDPHNRAYLKAENLLK
jgi:hypothetical protein